MGYLITIKGESKTSYKDLKQLDGIDCQDTFSEYFDDDFTFKDNVEGGYMYFKYDSDLDKLFTITVYNSDRELSKEELDILEDYTTGQWSDGIGEGFEQEPISFSYDEEEIYISPWFPGQETIVTQQKIEE